MSTIWVEVKMAETRLSKLQKWVLKTAYKNSEKFISKEDIYRTYFGHSRYRERFYEWHKEEEWYKKSNSHRVVLCRSLNVLEKRSLIEIERWRGKWAAVNLTEAGKEKALMLISSTKKAMA